ncbi:MAG: cache domain-containing protein [Arcobacteraceae bacterium]|nr:cache domain-containing protein [Arcobacteraceae bacterium]
MESVEDYRENLQLLEKSWDNLTIMGQLGGNNIDMNSTKKSFANLTEQLLNHLGIETIKKTSRQMQAKAQIAVDIVIRNLFERTADIGFLATDEDIRDFLNHTVSKYDESYENNISHLKNRFEEYVQKYSVYFDIVLMDTHGNVLVNLDENTKIKQSKDEIINLSLNTQEDYVETYKYHDFSPKYKKTLVYSYKVTKTNEKDSEAIGILALCFKFTDEMKGIFENLVNKSNQECLTLLDKSGHVIASSDKYQIPLGAKMEIATQGMHKIVSFGGRYYLSKTAATNGYQGFKGLDWYGHIMVPLEHAFLEDQSNLEISEDILQAILQYGDSFSDELKQIPIQANQIQENLNRAVWNGNVSQSKDSESDKGFSRLLLNEIAKTGEETKNIFKSSIINLTKTIILNDTISIASLMIDIMDRNLYERANDCRWWALNSEFRTILDNNIITSDLKNKLSSTLSYINNLYTVYTNLFIYDKNGVILAVSQNNQEHLIGKKLDTLWSNKTLSMKDSSKYCVSDFESTDLYDNKPTYIYNAPIESSKSENTIVGGIGIVFDSEIEFKAMIDESMPRTVKDEVKNGVFGVFTTKNKTIISSSNQKYSVGSYLDITDKFFNLKNGETYSEIITLDNKFYTIGVKCSNGYREFKNGSDDYKNDVYSFFFSYISEANIPIETSKPKLLSNDVVKTQCDDCQEIATFRIGSKYLGSYCKDVVQSVSIDKLETAINLDDTNCFKGTIIHNKMAVSVLDISSFIKEPVDTNYNEIVIVDYEDSQEHHFVGLLVSKLENIVDIETKKLKPLEQNLITGGALIQSIVSVEQNGDNKLLTILDIKKLANKLTN